MPTLARTDTGSGGGGGRASLTSPSSPAASATKSASTTTTSSRGVVAANAKAKKSSPPARITGAAATASKKGSNHSSSHSQPTSSSSSSSKPSTSVSPTVISVAADRSPSPPPSAPEIQLTLWLKVLRRRQAQVRRLANSNLLRSFVTDIVADMAASRYHDQDRDEGGGQQQQHKKKKHKIDLATGLYSSYLLTQSTHQQTTAQNTTASTSTSTNSSEISVEEIGNHFLALFYRSIDERLPYSFRKHGLDSLRRIFQKLDLRLKEVNESKEGRRAAGEKRSHELATAMDRSGDDLRPGAKKRKSVDIHPFTLQFNSTNDSDGNNSMITEKDTPEPARRGLVAAQQQPGNEVASSLGEKKKRKTVDSLSRRSTNESTNDPMQLDSTTEKDVPAPPKRWGGFVATLPQQIGKADSSSHGEKDRKSMNNISLADIANRFSRGPGQSTDDTRPFNVTQSTISNQRMKLDLPEQATRGLGVAQQHQQGLEVSSSLEGGKRASTDISSKDNTYSRSQRGSGNNALPVNTNNNSVRTENGATAPVLRGLVLAEQHRVSIPFTKQVDGDVNVGKPGEILDGTSAEALQASGSMQNVNSPPDTLHEVVGVPTEINGDNAQHDSTAQMSNNNSPKQIQNDQLPATSREAQSNRNRSEPSSMSKRHTLSQEPPNSVHVTCAPPSIRREPVLWDKNRRNDPPQSAVSYGKAEKQAGDTSNDALAKEASRTLPPSHAEPQKSNLSDGNKTQASVSLTHNDPVDKDGMADFGNSSHSTPDCINVRLNCGMSLDTNHRVATSLPKTAHSEVESNVGAIGEHQTAFVAPHAVPREATQHAGDFPCTSEVIDLTDDLDDSPPSNSLKLPEPSSAGRPIKHNYDDEDTSYQNAPLDSPSPSPVPFPELRNLPPLPLPHPIPFNDVQTISFIADDNPTTNSRALSKRPKSTVMFNAGFQLDGSASCLDDAHCIGVSERLKTWDPNWKIIEELGRRNVAGDAGSSHRIKTTKVGTRTAPCIDPVVIRQCARIYVDLPNDIATSDSADRNSTGKVIPIRAMAWGVKWGKPAHPDRTAQLQTGDRRLLVRTLPLERSAKDVKGRADCHIWPIGTFLSLKRGGTERVLSPHIVQRIQQSHAPSEWKGMSRPLDLTEHVSTDLPFEIKLCSYESTKKSSTSVDILLGSYAVQLAICEYVSPDDLYDQLMGKAAECDVIIPTISLKSATKMAKQFLVGQTVSIIDSDDENNEDETGQENERDPGNSLIFSLLCSISKTAIQTPVRGRNCSHLQCFDLRNYLHANKSVSGGRWRCAVCEDFVSVRDLVRCGLFQSMIDAVGGQISASRDRVLFHSDGTWRLLEEKSRSTAYKKSESVDDIIELV